MLELLSAKVFCETIGWHLPCWHVGDLKSSSSVFLSKPYVLDVDVPKSSVDSFVLAHNKPDGLLIVTKDLHHRAKVKEDTLHQMLQSNGFLCRLFECQQLRFGHGCGNSSLLARLPNDGSTEQ